MKIKKQDVTEVLSGIVEKLRRRNVTVEEFNAHISNELAETVDSVTLRVIKTTTGRTTYAFNLTVFEPKAMRGS